MPRAVLTLFLAYFLLGHTLNRFYPIHTPEDWYNLYLFATLPRSLGLAFLIYAGFRSHKPLPLADTQANTKSFLINAALMTALWGVLVSKAEGPHWTATQAAVGLLALPLVGLFEEMFFRGAVLSVLRTKIPPRYAALISALAFTIFHTRPQAMAAWPHIFLTGLIFANLRLTGFSLLQLALIHCLADAWFFIVPQNAVPERHLQYWVFLAGLFVYAAVTGLTVPEKEGK